MAWRDQWQKASFRNVEFRFRTASASLGRRNVVHQYPGRDDAYVEDLGRRAREFTIEAFVIGENYLAWRDQLEAACEKEGPGELVHPTRGRMLVAVQDCRPTESIDTGGVAGFSLTFVQTGVNRNPVARVDTPSVVDSVGDGAIDAVSGDFSGVFNVDGLQDFVEEDALQTITQALDEVAVVANGMVADMSVLPAFTRDAQSVLSRLSALMRTPVDLAAGISGQISGVRGLGMSPVLAFKALSKLFDFGNDKPSFARTTPSRIQQGDNRGAVYALVRRSALIEAAKSAARSDFASRNEAIAVRDSLAARLDAEAESAPDDVYVALTDLRVAVIRDLGERSLNLPSLISYTPKSTLPALVLAYRLYDDPERESEIISRNQVRHPGFIPGGVPLDLLTEG